MKIENLKSMTKGWFVGDFLPTALNTKTCEVAVKYYKSGDREEAHYHKIATEITLILSGSVRMCGRVFVEGEIVVLAPGEVTDFEALTDATNVVVKVPGVRDDKYLHFNGDGQ